MLQDKRFKNRELQIMKMMGHPNVVDLQHCFYTTEKNEVGSQALPASPPHAAAPVTMCHLETHDSSRNLRRRDPHQPARSRGNHTVSRPQNPISSRPAALIVLQVYLNLVLEFVPETVYRISKHYAKAGQRMPGLYVKLYTYQMCRSLAYIHSLGVCHRDIKPQVGLNALASLGFGSRGSDNAAGGGFHEGRSPGPLQAARNQLNALRNEACMSEGPFLEISLKTTSRAAEPGWMPRQTCLPTGYQLMRSLARTFPISFRVEAAAAAIPCVLDVARAAF